MCNDNAPFYLPSLERSVYRTFEFCRESLLSLPLITQSVLLCHCSLVEIRKQWGEPLDMVVWLRQKLGDGDWVMEVVR